MGVPPLGKPDAGAFLDVVDDYHVGSYGAVEMLRARLLPGLRGNEPEVLAALDAWGGEVHVHEHEHGADVVLVRSVDSAPPRWLLHGVLFVVTLISALAAGAFLRGID